MTETVPSKQLMSNRLYDFIKYAAQIVLPGLGTLYFALAQIWGVENGAEVVGTITAVDAFLGLLLGLSTKVYESGDAPYDGTVVVTEVNDVKLFSLNLEGDPNDIEKMKTVTFRVNGTTAK